MNTIYIKNNLLEADWTYDELHDYITELGKSLVKDKSAMAAVSLENFRAAVLAMRVVCNELEKADLDEIVEKANKWDEFCANQASHLNSGTAEERSERARRAVQARWAKKKESK